MRNDINQVSRSVSKRPSLSTVALIGAGLIATVGILTPQKDRLAMGNSLIETLGRNITSPANEDLRNYMIKLSSKPTELHPKD